MFVFAHNIPGRTSPPAGLQTGLSNSCSLVGLHGVCEAAEYPHQSISRFNHVELESSEYQTVLGVSGGAVRKIPRRCGPPAGRRESRNSRGRRSRHQMSGAGTSGGTGNPALRTHSRHQDQTSPPGPTRVGRGIRSDSGLLDCNGVHSGCPLKAADRKSGQPSIVSRPGRVSTKDARRSHPSGVSYWSGCVPVIRSQCLSKVI